MAHSQTMPVALPVQGRATLVADRVATIPWTIWLIFAGIFSGMIGGIWDISWHESIGRDTFWTPAHILIQLTGVLVGIACAYAILTTTFGGVSAARDASVQVLGFRGPVGAFIATWGCVAMLASAPFDNWWHNAYGLDVKIASPPHVLLSLGSFAIKIGAMAWMASLINRFENPLRSRLSWLFLYVAATGVAQLAVFTSAATWLPNMHSASCYLVVALFIPAMLVGPGWGVARRWGCTLVAAGYTVIGLGSEWLLPLFPAQPKLGPVYHNVTHLIPLKFPLLLIVPAVVVDLLLQRLQKRSPWMKAALVGPAFLFSFLAVQWPFANFLMTPAARSWVFGSHYFAYFDPAGVLYDPYTFAVAEKTGMFMALMLAAIVASILTSRLGLALGDWMRRVRR